MTEIEKERGEILERLNNMARRLSPTDALKLNEQLREVVKWLMERGSK